MKINIIKASEEVFSIDKEMSLDEQSDQLLRQIGFKFGAEWAVNKACEWLGNNLPPAMVRSDYYMFNGEFIEDFKKAMEGGDE